MELKVSIYYRNKKTNFYQVINDTITDEDLSDMAKQKTQDSLPMWMSEEWEFESVNVDNVEL